MADQHAAMPGMWEKAVAEPHEGAAVCLRMGRCGTEADRLAEVVAASRDYGMAIEGIANHGGVETRLNILEGHGDAH